MDIVDVNGYRYLICFIYFGGKDRWQLSFSEWSCHSIFEFYSKNLHKISMYVNLPILMESLHSK